MKKKLLSLVLAATMLLGASMTVFAATGSDVSFGDVTSNTESGTKDVTGSVAFEGQLPAITISVKVSNGGSKIIMNPYKLQLNKVDSSVSYNSMVLPDISFNNLTEVPVSLGISGYIDLSGNAATTSIAPSLTPLAPTTKRQVHVDVTFTADQAGTLKLWSTTTKADAGTPYVIAPLTTGTAAAIATSVKATEIKNSPTLAKSGTTAVSGGEKTSDTVYLKFNGWCVPMTGEQWPENALVNVVTKYNIKTESDTKCSSFK